MSKTNSIKEVVVYRIKPNQTEVFLKKGLAELSNCVAGFNGLIKHDTLVSTKDDGVFIDLVEWESLEAADSAAAQLEAKTKAGELPLMNQTFERVEFFDHFKALL